MNPTDMPDALSTPAGNRKLPPCELCKVEGVSIPAHFIVDRAALCHMHWREVHGPVRERPRT